MDTAFARRQMVRQQVRTWDVTDTAVLDLLGELERDRFVPPEFRDLAYADTEIPLPNDQFMMPPLVEGRLLQALALNPGDRVLEIGTGSGYLAACLAKLCSSVVSIDIFADLADAASERLAQMGITNVDVRTMDAMQELPEGPFDVIAVTGSTSEFHQHFADALAPQGRLFVIVGEAPVMQARLVIRHQDDAWAVDPLFETCVQPLVGGARDSTFAF